MTADCYVSWRIAAQAMAAATFLAHNQRDEYAFAVVASRRVPVGLDRIGVSAERLGVERSAAGEARYAPAIELLRGTLRPPGNRFRARTHVGVGRTRRAGTGRRARGDSRRTAVTCCSLGARHGVPVPLRATFEVSVTARVGD